MQKMLFVMGCFVAMAAIFLPKNADAASWYKCEVTVGLYEFDDGDFDDVFKRNYNMYFNDSQGTQCYVWAWQLLWAGADNFCEGRSDDYVVRGIVRNGRKSYLGWQNMSPYQWCRDWN